jgi:hypothetical protein
MREARAYAKSIYLMAGMPYLLLSGFGIYVYRAMRAQKRGESPEGELPE